MWCSFVRQLSSKHETASNRLSLRKFEKKSIWVNLDKTGALLGHFISAKLGKNDFILLEESKNDYERKIKRHKNNLYNK